MNKIKIPKLPDIQYLDSDKAFIVWNLETAKSIDSINLERIGNSFSENNALIRLDKIADHKIHLYITLPKDTSPTLLWNLSMRFLILIENCLGLFTQIEGLAREYWKIPFLTADKFGVLNAYKTPLMLSAEKGDLQAVQSILILEKEENINKVSPIGSTAIMYAALYGYLEVVNLLLHYGASVKVGEGEGVPMQAAVSGGYEIAKMFIDLGANVNAMTNYRETALMSAASRYGIKQIPIIKLLIENGADINIVSNFGLTALDLAFGYKNREVCEVLINFGAKRNYKG